jgi:uncharacterized membrane protein
VWIVVAGMAGTLMDSLVGGLWQAEYRCPVCGDSVSTRVHCNHQPTVLTRGWSFVNNDVVNWLCAATGALVMVASLASGGA